MQSSGDEVGSGGQVLALPADCLSLDGERTKGRFAMRNYHRLYPRVIPCQRIRVVADWMRTLIAVAIFVLSVDAPAHAQPSTIGFSDCDWDLPLFQVLPNDPGFRCRNDWATTETGPRPDNGTPGSSGGGSHLRRPPGGFPTRCRGEGGGPQVMETITFDTRFFAGEWNRYFHPGDWDQTPWRQRSSRQFSGILVLAFDVTDPSGDCQDAIDGKPPSRPQGPFVAANDYNDLVTGTYRDLRRAWGPIRAAGNRMIYVYSFPSHMIKKSPHRGLVHRRPAPPDSPYPGDISGADLPPEVQNNFRLYFPGECRTVCYKLVDAELHIGTSDLCPLHGLRLMPGV